MSSEIDYLDEDPILVPSQNFTLITFMLPQDTKGDHKFAFKLRGSFKTREEADHFMTKLNQRIPKNQQTPTFLVENGKWLAGPPPTNEEIAEHGGDTVYQEEFLQTLAQEYRKNQEEANEFFESRKNEVKQHGLENDPEPFTVDTK